METTSRSRELWSELQKGWDRWMDNVSASQYEDSHHARIRRAWHECNSSGKKITDILFERLKDEGLLRPGMDIVDVGCGDGRDLICLAADYGINAGSLIGIEPPAKGDRDGHSFAERFEQSRTLIKEKEVKNVFFLPGFAQQLPSTGGDTDIAMVIDAAYHFAPHIGPAFDEIDRILKPGGLAVVTTNAEDHKGYHHGLLADLGIALDSTPPGPLSIPFRGAAAYDFLKQRYKYVEAVELKDTIPVTTDNLSLLFQSINTYYNSFQPQPNPYKWSLCTNKLKQSIMRRLDAGEEIFDTCHKVGFYCSDPQLANAA